MGADSDGDGVDDCADACPEDPDKSEPGECGCGVPEGCNDTDEPRELEPVAEEPVAEEPMVEMETPDMDVDMPEMGDGSYGTYGSYGMP